MLTEETELTALSSAWVAVHYIIVKVLVENGVEVNKILGLTQLYDNLKKFILLIFILFYQLLNRESNAKDGFSPLYYWFTRMRETTDIFEYKNIWWKITEKLLKARTNIDLIK